MPRFLPLLVPLLALMQAASQAAPAPRPNVLLIVADDLGYSDLGGYGGEIATPHLDALARDGLRFTQFYNTARCWPSRAAILTGRYAQEIRRDTVEGLPSGTAGRRPPWAHLLPELLRPFGYRSYHSGKWHVDGKPLENGFDHSYSLDDHDRHFYPQLHSEDGVRLPAVATNAGYYSSTAIADHAIRCLKDHATNHLGRPFFSFVAFTAPHFPLQAPAEDVDRYREPYRAGWDGLRGKRWSRMQALGIGGSTLSAVERTVGPPYAFPKDLERLGPDEVNRPVAWDDLAESQRHFQADKMAVHAAMVDRMDREIGRVLGQVRAMGAEEDTLVLFLSDNGASAEMMVRGDGHNPDAMCGTGATFLSLGPGWSTLANTPFRRHKTWVHEGGISTPLVVRWPRGIAARGELRRSPGHVVDLAPTVLELAGGRLPDAWDGKPLPPAPGRSLVPVWKADEASQVRTLWWRHEGNRALRVGDWKLVASGTDAPWELYDLSSDRSESADLAASQPAKVRELAAEWARLDARHASVAHQDLPEAITGWKHSGSVFVLTTPDGADLPASARLQSFPLLVRLHRDFFPFDQAQAGGEDLRVSTVGGVPLAFQIEEWNPVAGTASVWVRVPEIRGNDRQELRLHWGNPKAVSRSDGAAVFHPSNGHLSVWHLAGSAADGPIGRDAVDTGTTATNGVIGAARHFPGNLGLFVGDRIVGLPQGAEPHSSEAWVRAERPNTTLFGWGNEGGGRGSKIRLQLRSPSHFHVDSDFSDVRGRNRIPLHQWVHVVHTYDGREGRLYVDGVLDSAAAPRLAIRSPARFWIGGWYDHYDFVGDLDEVRLSNVARSAEWIRLEHVNQRPLQTVVGPVVQAGESFGVTPAAARIGEGTSVTFTAQAGGVMQVRWLLREDGRETLLATDRLRLTVDAGRVAGPRSRVLRFQALGRGGWKSQDIPLEIGERIPDPVFRLEAPRRWNGRTPIEIVPHFSNRAALSTTGAGPLRITWAVSNLAVVRDVDGERLRLVRALNSGPLVVTATADNGGTRITRTATIQVREPARDPWIERIPDPEERPVDNQFIARNERNEGLLFWTGRLTSPADAVFLRLSDDQGGVERRQVRPDASGSYALSATLRPGLIRYRVEFGMVTAGRDILLGTATNLVCGDVFLIDGQSNAVATDWGPEEPEFRSDWIRTFGARSDATEDQPVWGNALYRSSEGGRHQIGYWGMELARQLVERHHIPVCILNGAVGGTRIDQHQRSVSNPADRQTLYGHLLDRVRRARLTQGVRGVFWHQGENDQGADGPDGGFGWENYRSYFLEMAAGWQRDYPNLRHRYLFQIWPKSCAMGIDGSDDRLREVQRNLPSAFSNLSLMSTVGITPPGECHYPAAGYAEFARRILPLVERDVHGVKPSGSITPPNLVRAAYGSSRRDSLVLEFDQPVTWDDSLASEFRLDGATGRVGGGQAVGKTLRLRLAGTSEATKLTYLTGSAWSPKRVLRGTNGIAALTFCEVPIEAGR